MTAVKYHGGRNYKSTHHNTHRPTHDSCRPYCPRCARVLVRHWAALVAFCAPPRHSPLHASRAQTNPQPSSAMARRGRQVASRRCPPWRSINPTTNPTKNNPKTNPKTTQNQPNNSPRPSPDLRPLRAGPMRALRGVSLRSSPKWSALHRPSLRASGTPSQLIHTLAFRPIVCG